MTQRIGIYGGSFDPIHVGHLLLAECCRESLSLDVVLFLVANVNPLKTHQYPIDNKHRIEMIRLAIGGHTSFAIDTREVDRGGTSYTIDSVRAIRNERPTDTLFLLMGADSLVEMAQWKEPDLLFQMVQPAVISRGGMGPPPWERLAPFVSSEVLERARDQAIAAPQIEISSRDLRARVQAGKSIRYQVTPAVETYIREHHLYRP